MASTNSAGAGGAAGLGRRVPVGEFSSRGKDALLADGFDRTAIATRGPKYERLDQLPMEVLLGARRGDHDKGICS